MRGLLVAAILVFSIFGTSAAWGQSRADLEKARAAYLARNYAEAEERLRALVDPKTGVKELTLLSQARMYLGAVLLAQGKHDQAVDVFEKLILEDPPFEPDPLGYPTDVINTFIDVRLQLQERLRQAAQNAAKLEAERRARAEEEKRKQEEWLGKVKAMAQEEKITVRNNRLLAFLPFGVGQFQNGQPILGWTFLVSEAALVVGTAVTIPMYSYARGRAEEEARAGDIERKADLYQERADTIQVANLSMAGAFGLLAVAGIVQANIAYVPETFETKKRELPPLSRTVPRISPIVAPLAGGAFVGLSAATF